MVRKLPQNWRSRIEIKQEDSHHFFHFVLQFKSKAPKGFKKEIGHLTIDNDPPYFVSDVYIEEEFRGKGLGFKLYCLAIKKLGRLSTKFHKASPEAQNLWKKLVKKYKSRKNFFKGSLTVFNSAT